MRKQLQGAGLLLFGILLCVGIAGLVLLFGKGE